MGQISKQTSNALSHYMGLLLLSAFIVFHVSLTQSLTDPFQEAEYAVFGFLAQTQADFRIPILIHGGLDTVPSRIAAISCAVDTQIACVRIINSFFQLGVFCLFISVLATLTGLGSATALFSGLPAVIMLWFYDGQILQVVDAQQSTPGIRDLFVMASLLFMARLCREIDKGATRDRSYYLFLLGVLAGTGIFWAYNRGLVILPVLGVFVTGMCVFRRSLWCAIIPATGFMAGLAIVIFCGGLDLLSDTVFNLTYWSKNGEIWRIPFDDGLAVPFFSFVVIMLGVSLVSSFASLRRGQPGTALIVLIFSLVLALYAAQSMNRPDIWHLRWVVWPATLIMAVVIRDHATALNVKPALSTLGSVVLYPLLFIVCIEIYADNSTVRSILSGISGNIRAMINPLPSDREIAGEELTRIADLVTKSARCTFAANNSGIIYLLSRAKPCSRFAFGTYIAPDRQMEVIAELELAQPEIVLWDSKFWWSHIDGRGFSERTPLLAAWIEARFPVRTTIGGQVLLSRSPLESLSLR